MELSDKEWEIIEPLLPELPKDVRGRPWRDNREVLYQINVIFLVYIYF